jgi:hypothetical protein
VNDQAPLGSFVPLRQKCSPLHAHTGKAWSLGGSMMLQLGRGCLGGWRRWLAALEEGSSYEREEIAEMGERGSLVFAIEPSEACFLLRGGGGSSFSCSSYQILAALSPSQASSLATPPPSTLSGRQTDFGDA